MEVRSKCIAYKREALYIILFCKFSIRIVNLPKEEIKSISFGRLIKSLILPKKPLHSVN